MSQKHFHFALIVGAAMLAALLPVSSFARDDSQEILSIDRYVPHTSTAPPIGGRLVELHLRERVQVQSLAQGPSVATDVVLFVHGAWFGSTGAFDTPYQDYSWMAYLAQHGFDAFSLDLTGYGFSTRQAPLDDPCNLEPDQQTQLLPGVLHETCPPRYATRLTTIQSDWDDLDAAVDYLRLIRRVDRVSIVGWSLGGTWAGGYATLHPEKVNRLVLLGPAYDRDHPTLSAPMKPDPGTPVTLVSRDALGAAWDRQVQCSDQFDPGIRDAIWTEGLMADGVAWAPGLRRVPSAPAWLWNQSIAAMVQAPTLMISGELDHMSPATAPDAVRAAYTDLGTSHKVFLTLPCASHFAMWEARHLAMFQASTEWLRDGSVNGLAEGEVRLGA